MTDDSRVEQLYQLALDLPPAERNAFLRRECRGDAMLERQVQDLLEAFAAAPEGFLQSPSARWSGERSPESIGPYDLKDVLGEGGMGVVFRAHQREPVQRTVALKIVKLGMDTREVIRRFETERQALAQLEHPNIARVYDAGTTPDGRPFFAMEYVEGEPITQYCDERRLTAKERIELLIDVCRGVQHAHQQGIIHRDLKPTNILVSEQDGRALPKIIDFGVAKATRREWNQQTLYTQHGQLIGTPEYMSPEQASGGSIDTRSDVYSLGVVLYELLAGSLPLDAVALREAGFEGMMRMIREEEPPRPSTRVSTLGDSAGDTATRRRTRPNSLVRDLRGELDWIAMRALEKDRERRYETVAAFVADLGAHLRDEPVQARPDSAWYLLRKFTRRHRVAVGFAAVVALSIVTLAVTMTVQAGRIARERDRANEQAQIATEVKDFLVKVFEVSSPEQAQGKEVTARELLDDASQRVSDIEDPVVRAELTSTLGFVYWQLGQYEDARRFQEEAHALWLQERGPNDPHTIVSLHDRGLVAQSQGALAEAESLYTATIAAWNQAGLGDDARVLDARLNLANCYRSLGRVDDSETLLRALLDEQREAFGDDDPTVMRVRNNLAMTLRWKDDFEEAAEQYEQALASLRRTQGNEHPQTFSSMTGLAWTYTELERYDEAEALLKEVVASGARVLGEEHPDYLVSVEALGYLYFQLERLDEAQRCFEEVLKGRRSSLGDEHPATLVAMNNVAAVYAAREQHQKAIELYLGILELRRRVSGDDHPMTNGIRINLATSSAQLGKMDSALSYLRDAVDRGWYGRFLFRDSVVELFAPLDGDPEYERLIAEVRRRLEED